MHLCCLSFCCVQSYYTMDILLLILVFGEWESTRYLSTTNHNDFISPPDKQLSERLYSPTSTDLSPNYLLINVTT